MRLYLIILVCFSVLRLIPAPVLMAAAVEIHPSPAVDNLCASAHQAGSAGIVQLFSVNRQPGHNAGMVSLASPGVYFTLDGGWGPYLGNAIIQFDGNEYAYDPTMGGVLIYCSPGTYPYVITPADESKAINRGTVTVAATNPVPVKIDIADAHRVDIFVNDQDMNALKGAAVSFAGVMLYTDENGLASFDRYPLGTYSYSVSYPGYISIENQSFEVMAQVETITILLNRYVYDATFSVISGNIPLEGASISLQGIVKTTDNKGTATFGSLAEGTYDYIVTKTGYFDEKGSIVINDGNVFREINLVSITGTAEAKSANPGLYPNPGNGCILVSLPENCRGEFTITITDIQGNILLESKLDVTTGQIRLDASGLKNGIYLITASGSSFKRTFRFIKQ
jgi:hypothetical protein